MKKIIFLEKPVLFLILFVTIALFITSSFNFALVGIFRGTDVDNGYLKFYSYKSVGPCAFAFHDDPILGWPFVTVSDLGGSSCDHKYYINLLMLGLNIAFYCVVGLIIRPLLLRIKKRDLLKYGHTTETIA